MMAADLIPRFSYLPTIFSVVKVSQGDNEKITIIIARQGAPRSFWFWVLNQFLNIATIRDADPSAFYLEFV